MGEFENRMEKAVEDGTIMGAAVFAKDKTGKLNYAKTFGKRALSPEEKPMEKDTVFLLASMTKIMTTIAAMQVVENGLISLDDDVTPMLPVLAAQEVLIDFPEDGKAVTRKRQNPITLRQLLTHSFGGAYEFRDARLPRLRKLHGTKQGSTVNTVFDTPLLFEPGESWAYSGGVDWAGKLVQELTGLPLEEYMRQNIWGPLGLRDVSFWPDTRPGMVDRLAAMSLRGDGGTAVQSAEPVRFDAGMEDALGGQGGYATAADMTEILYSLLVDDERLLKKETTATMFKPHLSPAAKAALVAEFRTQKWATGVFPDTQEYDWGLGGMVVDGHKHPYRKSGTMMWAGSTNITWFIDRESGVCGVFGCNLLPPGDVKIRDLVEALEEEVYSQVGIKTRL